MKTLNLSDSDILRQNAEKLLKSRQLKSELKKSDLNILKLNHELQVHQIELEMQNEELVLAKLLTDAIAEKYIELYNFAPLGFFTLTKKGDINELNHFGSFMLGNEYSQFENIQFSSFVVDIDKPIFNTFLEKIFHDRNNETCMLSMSLNDNIIKQVLITGVITKTGEQCLITVADVSVHMQMEKESKALQEFNNYFIGRELKMVELKKEINELLKKEGSENKYPV